MSPFLIREAVEGDRAFIENAWRMTMLATCPAVQGAEPRHFHTEMRRVLDRLMPTLPSSGVRVACDPKDQGTLVGFVASTINELHYAYVAGSFRTFGIVPALLDGLKIQRYTFQTAPGIRRLKPKERGWSFCPRFTIF